MGILSESLVPEVTCMDVMATCRSLQAHPRGYSLEYLEICKRDDRLRHGCQAHAQRPSGEPQMIDTRNDHAGYHLHQQGHQDLPGFPKKSSLAWKTPLNSRQLLPPYSAGRGRKEAGLYLLEPGGWRKKTGQSIGAERL